jgi:hypothetical protein
MVCAVLIRAPLVTVKSDTPAQYLNKFWEGLCVLTDYHIFYISKVKPIPNNLTRNNDLAYIAVPVSL